LLFDRFLDWKAGHRRNEFQIQWGFLGPSFNYDIGTLSELVEFQKRIGSPWDSIPLGGLKARPEAEMREWLRVRQNLGFKSVGVSMVGHGAVHDQWNGREGDFKFLMNTQRAASELGMEVHQGFFLVKDTLPILDETVRILDAHVGPATQRYVRPFMAAGYGSFREDERLVESDIEQLPTWVTDLLRAKDPVDSLHSEQEWMEILRSKSSLQKENVFLYLNVNDGNISDLEALSCDEIVVELEERTREVLDAMPSVPELVETCGDAHGKRMYDCCIDVERIWMDRYTERCRLDLDWSLLPDYVGRARSKNPPPITMCEG
jgi:hypothetical protein